MWLMWIITRWTMWIPDWPGPVVLDDETINSNNASLKRFVDRERSAAANRMSHIFGLTGPTSTAETACSKPRMDSMSSPTGKKNMQKSTNLVFQSWHIVPPPKKTFFFVSDKRPLLTPFWLGWGSSSLVALGIAQMTMRRGRGKIRKTIRIKLAFFSGCKFMAKNANSSPV